MKPRTAKSEYARALDLLTRYLALRDHSRFELHTKLSRRFPPEIVQQVLSDAEQHGWLIPEQAMAERAALALQRQLKSQRQIEGKLRRRRLPLPVFVESDEVEKARVLAQKKFGPLPELSYDERGKVFRYLKFRGFKDRVIRRVLHAES